jgi:2'-5' RNA ligase
MRLFVALELPAGVRAALAACGEAIAAAEPGLRAQPAESLHITLCFLGERAEEDVARIAGALRGLPGPAPELRVTGLLSLPPRRPRAIAAELGERGERLRVLHHTLEAALTALQVYAPERRPFRPHVTLARGRQEAGASIPAPPRLPPAFRPDTVTLFSSRAGPGESVYVPLRRTGLGAAAP